MYTVVIPGDQNITKKEFEKINNCSELRVEIALGSIPKNLHRHLESLGIKVKTSFLKLNSFFLKLCRFYSSSLKMLNKGEFPYSLILGDRTLA